MMNIDLDKIWRERSQHYYTDLMHYWRLIGSSGLLFTIVVLTIIGIIYYPDFLEWLPEQVPLAFLLAFLLAWFIAPASFRTLLKEADLIFLTPVENKMEVYFQKAYSYNLLVQCTAIILLLLIFSPLYHNKIALPDQPLWLYFITPLILKGWNTNLAWMLHRVHDERIRRIHTICRFVFHFLFLYWFFSHGNPYWLLLFAFAVLGFYLYDRQVKQNYGYHWLHLLEMEGRLEARFYQFASMFVDVPKLPGKVKRRTWINGVTKLLPFQSTQAYRYLYLKTFFRSNEYFSLFIRLTLIGTFLVYFIPNSYGKMVAYLVLLVMTSIQMKAIMLHHQRQFWFRLFPLPESELNLAYVWLKNKLLITQSIVMWLPLIIGSYHIEWFILLAMGLLYSYLYPYAFLASKLSKK